MAEAPGWNGGVYEDAESTGYESGEKIAGQEFFCLESFACSVCKASRRKQQQRMKIMKDMTKNIRSKRKDGCRKSTAGAELLAADCEKAWIRAGEEETMQKWYAWLEKMKKEDEKRKITKGNSDDQECGR